jgi:hypothetical protein
MPNVCKNCNSKSKNIRFCRHEFEFEQKNNPPAMSSPELEGLQRQHEKFYDVG